jgi:hypothetical protein
MTAALYELNTQQHSDQPIWLPEGEYTAAYKWHTTWLFKGRYPKVVITFVIQDYGEHFEKEINAYYIVKSLKGKPRKRGSFSAGWKSNFMLDYTTLYGKPERKDRFNMSNFNNGFVKIEVRTVKKNRDQREYPESLQYSVVSRILGLIEI